MLEQLKKEVYYANLELQEQGLIKYTWGNVSGVSREHSLFVIKPSGVKYEDLKIEDMVVCDFDGNVVEGELKPSSDTATHAVLYKNNVDIGGIVHTHSMWATIWAQSNKDVPTYGTTHADTFYGDIPCARYLTEDEVSGHYEKETGNVILETFKNRNLDMKEIPGVLLSGHGPFTWGKDADEAVVNAVVLEEVSKMAYYTNKMQDQDKKLPQHVLDKHYLRKHGKNAYYGQK